MALSNTDIQKVSVDLAESNNEQPEVNVSDEELLQFDISEVPIVITITKVSCYSHKEKAHTCCCS